MVSKLSVLTFANVKLNNRIAYLLNTLSVIILVFSAMHYIVYHWFTVKRIIIYGQLNRITPVQLSYIANNRLHGTFFTLDIAGLKAEFQALPWVRQVRLKRDFPHTIEVYLEEYKAVARLGSGELVANDGIVFDGAESDLNLPTFFVSNSSLSDVLRNYAQIESALNLHHDSLVELWQNGTRITKFTTRGGLSVTICDKDITNKLTLLGEYWDKMFQLNPKLSAINLCYKNAIAINSMSKGKQ